jgi:hypothetical protein
VENERGSRKTFSLDELTFATPSSTLRLGRAADAETRSGRAALGAVELTAGEHRLCVEIVGANPAAIRRHMFSLDYVRLAPKP